ncbi:hypothetical protein D3C80_1564470 [compost metagenome]
MPNVLKVARNPLAVTQSSLLTQALIGNAKIEPARELRNVNACIRVTRREGRRWRSADRMSVNACACRCHRGLRVIAPKGVEDTDCTELDFTTDSHCLRPSGC